MKTNARIVFLISFMVFLSSCDLIFGPDIAKIPRKYIVDYEKGDLIIFKNSELRQDTFEVKSYHFTEDEQEEWLGVSLKAINAKINFISEINAIYIGIYINVYDQYLSIYFNRDTVYDLEINGKLYKDVYIEENDLHGDSDTLLNKLIYHSKEGILGYRYENGDEYELDEIIRKE